MGASRTAICNWPKRPCLSSGIEQPVIVDGRLPKDTKPDGQSGAGRVGGQKTKPRFDGPALGIRTKRSKSRPVKSRSWRITAPGITPILAIYFTLTGLHALHVIAGCIVIFAIWGPLAKVWEQDPERYTNRVEVSGLFWHFVDLVWIFLFPVLYLL
jgi:hypothetical protein